MALILLISKYGWLELALKHDPGKQAHARKGVQASGKRGNLELDKICSIDMISLRSLNLEQMNYLFCGLRQDRE